MRNTKRTGKKERELNRNRARVERDNQEYCTRGEKERDEEREREGGGEQSREDK